VIEIRQAVAIYIAVLGQDLQFDGVMERCYLLSQRRYAGASQNTLSTDPLRFIGCDRAGVSGEAGV
jgi:hypothetical protein